MNVAYVRAHGLVRAGAMRKLAAFVHEVEPVVLGVCEIDAGDALALATRFALQWGYRGQQAMFWKPPVRAHAVHDRYLPVNVARLFERRGLLIVDAEIDAQPCVLAATQLSHERAILIRELRFTRAHLRTNKRTLFFADMPEFRIGFSDLGLARIDDGIYARGFPDGAIRGAVATV